MEYEIGRDESVSAAVVHAVSAVENRDPLTLEPLGDVLDPEAVDTVFGSQGEGTPHPTGHLTFVYSQCRVTVDKGEYLTLQPIDHRIRTAQS